MGTFGSHYSYSLKAKTNPKKLENQIYNAIKNFSLKSNKDFLINACFYNQTNTKEYISEVNKIRNNREIARFLVYNHPEQLDMVSSYISASRAGIV